MAQAFSPGDIVKLKSGGPAMTVEQIGSYTDPSCVVCSWFAGKKSETKNFAPEALKSASIDEDL